MSGWSGKLFFKSRFGLFGTSTDTGISLLDICSKEACDYLNSKPDCEYKMSHDLSVFNYIGYTSLATVVLLEKQSSIDLNSFGIWKKIIFTERKYAYFFGNTYETGIDMLEVCLSKAKHWINTNNIDDFKLSHDINIYMSAGATSTLASVIITYKEPKENILKKMTSQTQNKEHDRINPTQSKSSLLKRF